MKLFKMLKGVNFQLEREKPGDVPVQHRKLERPRKFRGLLQLYLQSSNFQEKAHRTKLDYKRYIKIIADQFGSRSVSDIENYKIRSEFLAWRDQVALKSTRTADYIMTVLGAVLSWAQNRALISQNHAMRAGKLYHGNRAAFVWSKDEIEAFLHHASDEMRLAMLLARDTGQRRGDLLKLTWNNYDGEYISLKQSKTGASVEIATTRALKKLLDDTKIMRKWCGINKDKILLSPAGKPWGESSFQKTWRSTSLSAGIENKKFQDLRGTTITALADAGCTTLEIAAVSGHTLKSVDTILKHYVVRTKAQASSAIRKLESIGISQN